MLIEDVKRNLNKRVHFKSNAVDADYILTACILRRGKEGFYYQAELQDLNQNRSVIIASLEAVQGMNSNYCVVCGEEIPEGTQVCVNCESKEGENDVC